jgi:alcohol dehydrogenase
MKAMCVVSYERPLELLERPRPSIPPGYALVEVIACGLCFSDVKTIRGKMPYSANLALPHVPGHEISGRVVEVNGESGFRAGDRVVVYHIWACGRCAACKRGDENLCRDYVSWMGFTDPGGFQEFVVAPVERLLRVPETIPATMAPALTCAMGTAYRAVATRGAVRPGESVAVLGLGGVGIHAAQIARASGARVIGVDLDESKLDGCRAVGIQDLASAGELEERVREFTGGEGIDVVIEATGAPMMLDTARRIARPGARIVAVGYKVGELAGISSDQLALWEYTVLGSRYASRAEIELGIKLVADGAVQLVVDDVLPLEQANDAVSRLEAGTVLGRLVLAVSADAGS